jgi:hypothetical protein
MGIGEIWYLRRAGEANVSGRFVCAEKAVGNWWEDQFWKGKSIEPEADG